MSNQSPVSSRNSKADKLGVGGLSCRQKALVDENQATFYGVVKCGCVVLLQRQCLPADCGSRPETTLRRVSDCQSWFSVRPGSTRQLTVSSGRTLELGLDGEQSHVPHHPCIRGHQA